MHSGGCDNPDEDLRMNWLPMDGRAPSWTNNQPSPWQIGNLLLDLLANLVDLLVDLPVNHHHHHLDQQPAPVLANWEQVEEISGGGAEEFEQT